MPAVLNSPADLKKCPGFPGDLTTAHVDQEPEPSSFTSSPRPLLRRRVFPLDNEQMRAPDLTRFLPLQAVIAAARRAAGPEVADELGPAHTATDVAPPISLGCQLGLAAYLFIECWRPTW